MENTEEKFREIYDKYKNLILKVAYDSTKDYYLAQDICQETFLKMYDYRDHLDETRVKSWLLVVTANQVRDHFKKGGRFKEVLDENGLMVDLHEHRNDIDIYLNQLDVRELQNRMLEGLRNKNPNWYDVLILVEYMNVPRKVVAQRKKIALSTVDSYLKKSKKWLCSNYKKEYDAL